MEQVKSYHYTYSAKENQEIQNIRKKYLPCKETELDELKRLDNMVQSAGITESLCAGIGGALVFGLGLCLSMKVIGSGNIGVILGVLLGVIGASGMLAAYPLYSRFYAKAKEKHAPRILELTEELTGECHKEASE